MRWMFIHILPPFLQMHVPKILLNKRERFKQSTIEKISLEDLEKPLAKMIIGNADFRTVKI